MRDFHQHNAHCSPFPSRGRKLALGMIILLLGIFFLLDNLGVLPGEVKSVIISWPMLLIAIGVINLFGRNSSFAGMVMIIIGLFFIVPDIFSFSFNFTSLLWPVLLIIIGLLIIFRKGFSRTRGIQSQIVNDTNYDPQNTIDEVNVFGGSKRMVISDNFKGGKITSIFGGTELDFSNVKLADGINILDMVCIFGGASIAIPDDWNVQSEMVSVLGGFVDQRKSVTNFQNSDKKLIIKGVAIFGGGEIKSHKS